jgi:3-oxoacyl-[acyl-carrier protein] reductase
MNEEKGAQTAAEINEKGGKAEFQKVNVAIYSEVETAVNEIISKYEKIDILVNNAGITRDSSLKKMTSEQWDQVIAVNLTGVFNCTKIISQHMIAQNYGRIVNTSSVVALYGNFGQTNYVATKAGVIGLTKTWAKELGRKGITVNAVAPGFILTDMVRKMPEEVLKAMEAKVPVGRLGDPSEIASIYTFLASDEAAYINGATISVDGGMTI